MTRFGRRILAGGGALAAATAVALAGGAAASAAPVSVGHSGWTWGVPSPQGQDLNAVRFDGATGYAVGGFGTALRSDDGGQTWTGLPSGTVEDLGVVQELSPSTVIVGGGCALRESTNGGQTFTAMPINQSDTSCSQTVAGASFVSASTGYVLESGGQLFYTTDGGRSVQVKTPVPVSFGQATGLVFTSPTTGFATTGSGAIEETTDGGNSWTQVYSSLQSLSAITFVNAQTAFAVGAGGTIVTSTDGGSTWTRVSSTLPPSASSAWLTHISCSDATNCLISMQTSASVLRTTDGGQTASIVTPASANLSDVAFAAGSNVVGVGAGGVTVLSPDGGAQFPTNVSSGGGLFDSTGEPLVAGGQPGSAYALGSHGSIEATTDGGATWAVLRTPSTAAVDSAVFPTTRTGYVVTDDRVLRKTTDGGGSWSVLDARVTASTAVAAGGAKTVILAGPTGIRRSTNGGGSFNAVAGRVKLPGGKRGPKVSSLKLSAATAGGRTLIAYGTRGAYTSVNGGRSWRSVKLPHKTRVSQLSFFGASTGYMLDAAGDILYTRNAGRRWRELLNVGNRDVTSMSFASAKQGMVALRGPLGPLARRAHSVRPDVLVTDNGGRSWEPQLIDGVADGVVLATAGHAYFANPPSSSAGGDALFETTDGGASPHRSKLTVSLTRRLSAKTLATRHHRVTIHGRLQPVTAAGERVIVNYRSNTNGDWRTSLVNVASNGSFQFTASKIKRTTDFVVYALGDGVNGGASGYARLTVTKSSKPVHHKVHHKHPKHHRKPPKKRR